MGGHIDRFSARILFVLSLSLLVAGAAAVADDAAADDSASPAPIAAPEDDAAVLEGLRIFTQETFGGNGRVCASCHPPTNNFTIDPAFIRKLPSTDPLFVAEFDPNLRGLERPKLLRQFGLVTANVDGFDKPSVARAVPHTLGLSQSIEKGATPFPRVHMTGWSGDGSPGDGSLRNFATGAIAQHLTRTLARRGCAASAFDPAVCDFRLPTDTELAALEQFQLFLGRQAEINIQPASSRPGEIIFLDPFVERGKELFHSVRGGNNFSCNSCHTNGGANDRAGNGRLINIGVNKHPNIPACRLPGRVPGDGGFGRLPETTESGQLLCRTAEDFAIVYQGKGQFNTPSIIEAADTGPFFHNNIVATLEEAVTFYNSEVFARSPAGGGIPFNLLDREVRQIAALLRILNVIDNIENGNRFDQLAQRAVASDPDVARLAVQIAASETQDAVQVLLGSPVTLYPDSGVVTLLRRALVAEQGAAAAWDSHKLDTAMMLKEQARARLIEVRP